MREREGELRTQTRLSRNTIASIVQTR